MEFSSNRHALILDFQHFPILDVLDFLDVHVVPIQMRDSPLETQDGLLQRNVQVDLQIVLISLHSGVGHLLKLNIDISRIKIKTLLRFTFEKHHISLFHALL
jgi:hypothetical protein